ncbi:MAG: Fpg/Nei family DNA glycosylase [Spirochaetota bacterium]
MPELPDVEYLREYAAATSLHREIAHTSLGDERLLAGTSRQLLARRLTGDAFDAARRHGKHLFLTLRDSAGALMLHFGMTGTLRAYGSGEAPEHTRLTIDFADGSHLAYLNTRLLGRIAITDDVDEYVRGEGLGPDALEVSLTALEGIVRGARGAIKSTLMNQHRLAGLGNIYTDEILFHARIDPRRACGEVDDEDLERLHAKIGEVCRTAIDAHADPERMPESWLIRRRAPGESCPVCGGTVTKAVVGGRSAYLCERCQC